MCQQTLHVTVLIVPAGIFLYFSIVICFWHHHIHGLCYFLCSGEGKNGIFVGIVWNLIIVIPYQYLLCMFISFVVLDVSCNTFLYTGVDKPFSSPLSPCWVVILCSLLVIKCDIILFMGNLLLCSPQWCSNNEIFLVHKNYHHFNGQAVI